jgi:hypothetical protein
MRKLGIIQPGKIGDIIICLPIAKWYYDRGYEVIWPVNRDIIDNFYQEGRHNYVPYVKFFPIEFDCHIARRLCTSYDCNTVIDLSFTIPGAHVGNTYFYLNQFDYTFDELKYHIANVPTYEKWNLHVQRNMEKEKQLVDLLCNYSEDDYDGFILVQESSSDQKREVDVCNPRLHRVNIKPVSGSVFDWISTIEKASKICVIESSISNMIDQLKIDVPDMTLMMKHGYYGPKLQHGDLLRGEPLLRGKWKKV